MQFRAWSDTLDRGPFGVMLAPSDAPVVAPETVLVPLSGQPRRAGAFRPFARENAPKWTGQGNWSWPGLPDCGADTDRSMG